MSTDENRSYLSDVAKAAPIFGLKSLLGDLPKGGIEYAVEKKTGGSSEGFARLLGQGLAGRGAGRALGATLGVATAPLFLQGVRLAGSQDPKKRHEGLAYLAGSAAIHQGLKGMLEDGFEMRRSGASLSESFRAGALLGGMRSLYKAPLAAIVGMSIASGRTKADERGSSIHKYVAPALTGAAIGALSRAGEGAVKELGSVRTIGEILTRAKPRLMGGAAGGLFGGIVAAGVTDAALKFMDGDKEKKAALDLPGFNLSEIIPFATEAGFHIPFTDIVLPVGTLAADLPYVGVLHGLTGAVSGGIHSKGLRALSPAAAAVGVEARARNLAIGIKEGVAGFTTPGVRGTTALNATAREFGIERTMGIRMGHFLRGVPEERRLPMLKRMAAFVDRNPQLLLTSRGHVAPVTGALPRATRMISGEEPLRTVNSRLTRTLDRLQHAGRLSDTIGLPVAGAMRAEPTKMRLLLEETPAALAGALGVAAATTHIPVASQLAGKAGTHWLFNAVKGAITNTSETAQHAGTKMMGEGFWKGLSGIGTTRPTKGWRALEYIASPAVLAPGAMGESAGMTVRALLAEHAQLKKLKALRTKDRGALTVNIGVPVLAAAGLGKLLRQKTDQ